ncbi:MAG: cytochrome c oxidase subunit 3 [Saprospiraceae bacterium]|nr:cytochrome c oxidase subunit 3 [Saprospiraceae bacterium]MDW8228785.1 cytochrome c oxidase subunit 3 [Saprospiraceae bacterium]
MSQIVQREYRSNNIHPLKFALWVGIATIIMMFGAFTSAYLVRRAAGNWYEFRLPDVFWLSTMVILLSSLTLHASYRAFMRGIERLYKSLLLTTLALGLIFVVLQYAGWQAMTAMGATFTVNPSSSFIYVISGIHALHVLGGVTALIVALIHAFALPFKPTPRRRLRFELVVHYWHFVDILWVYLFIFFLVQSP